MNNLDLNASKPIGAKPTFKHKVADFFHNLQFEDVVKAWDAIQVLVRFFRR